MSEHDTHGSRGVFRWSGGEAEAYRIGAVPRAADLPFAHKVLLENLLRHEDGDVVTRADIAALVAGDADREIAYHPSRAFLHDTNGVPVLTDLAAMRDVLARRGLPPGAVDCAIPAHLTADHSISTDFFARPDAAALNVGREYERNAERYRFLKWGERAFDSLAVVPPGAGIMHQVNVEHLARVVEHRDGLVFPDTVAGTDSHTTMVNGLSVLAWGVGGIEAEAAMLGQPISLLVPPVVGVELHGRLRPGVTATDLVLTLTERLRRVGVVGRIVEFCGEGVGAMSIATRCTLANMSPEFGSTAAMFPVDALTVDYLRLTGRSAPHAALVEAYAREQGLWHDPARTPRFAEVVRMDLDEVTPSLAGPRRPQDRVDLADTDVAVRRALAAPDRQPPVDPDRLHDGVVAIASITSCTNTSNPAVMVAAGLLARNAVARGLTPRPWVKTSLAPGSRVVVDYLARAGLMEPLERLGFGLVGYGCMTCIGNSGDLLPQVVEQVREHGLTAAAVLSGNRNFDGRINNDVGLNFLASPPLVVAFALAGTLRLDLTRDPLGHDPDGAPVMLADLWPSDAEVAEVARASQDPGTYTAAYASVFDGDEHWRGLDVPPGDRFDWEPDSTYLRPPPFLDGTPPTGPIRGARVLQLLGDSVTTDHICPAGRIPAASPAGEHLARAGVRPAQLNTYASRRGNWQVMRLGGFTNPGLANAMVPGPAGGRAVDLGPDGTEHHVGPVHEVADAHRDRGVPLVVIAGAQYGTGSSRDWAAKVTRLLGVRAVIAESFERIHRSNLVGMGVLPLELTDGQSAASLGLTGHEEYDVDLPEDGDVPATLTVTARSLVDGTTTSFRVRSRVDTGREQQYHRAGGILPFVLDRILERQEPTAGARRSTRPSWRA